MMWSRQFFSIADDNNLIEKMLCWADRYSIFCFLHGNGYAEDRCFPTILAVGAKASIALPAGSAFSQLYAFHQQYPGWLFGHLGYGLMEETLSIQSRHPRSGLFDDAFFFQPEILIRVHHVSIEIEAADPSAIYESIMQTSLISKESTLNNIQIQSRISKENYLESIQAIQGHLQAGDCYELNYCQEFFAQEAKIHPVNTFLKLMIATPNPFSALYKVRHGYCISSSPERFLQKKADRIISQPMKGTIRRDVNAQQDERNRSALSLSEKDKSENVMVVDLVRNDLSKFCEEGTVQVPELFAVHSYPYVHQMISTVEGRVDASLHWTEMVRHCFPMGSMTGAPKKRVAELIDDVEYQERGLFSGTIGYVTDKGDFDFNVLIRSIFYHAENHHLHFLAGGGITIYSDPLAEYEESCLKSEAMIRVLTHE